VADVFVSYSRRDGEFVGHLVESMTDQGKDVWVDTEGIADADVFPEAIKRAIEGSDAFLFVITPDSVHSRYCENEVEYARDLQKRIVPVLRNPVADSDLPAEIRDRNWIPFTEDAEFDPALGRLLTALDTDLEAAKAHTRWLVKALEWDSEGRDKSFLLRGSELRAAEAWLASRPEDADPAPTQLQREYLFASREAAARRQRAMMGGAVAIAAVSIGLLIFALISRGQAVSAKAQAVGERIGARSQALAAESQAQLPNDPEISLILGMRAVRTKATPQSLFALRAALDASPFERALATVAPQGACASNTGLSAVYSPTGRQIAEAACDGTLRLIDAGSGRLVRSTNLAQPLSAVAYSPDGSRLAVATGIDTTGTNTVLLFDPATGATRSSLTATLPGRVAAEQPTGVAEIAFSPNGRLLAADGPAGITLWSLPGGRARALERDPSDQGTMAFSRDGRLLIVGGTDNSVRVYKVASGRMVHRIVAPTDQGSPQGWAELVALSPDGSRLAIGYPTSNDSNGTVSVYSTATWSKQFDVSTIDQVEISSLAFSPDGTRLAIGAEDGTAGVWWLSSREQVAAYDGSTAAVGSMSFAPDGQSVVSASNDGVARVWRALGSEQSIVPLHGNLVGLALSPHQLTVLGTVHGRNAMFFVSLPSGNVVSTWRLGRGMNAPVLSSDGRLLATLPGGPSGAPPSPNAGPPSGPVRIWNVAQRRVVAVIHPPGAATVTAFSPDDRFVELLVGGDPNSPGHPVLLNVATGHTVTLQEGYPGIPCLQGNPSDFALSRNDRVFAASGFCGEVDLFNATTGSVLRQFNQGAEISAVDLTPDGSRLLVASWDSRATIYDVATGRPLVNLIGHTRGIAWGGFAAGGSLVVTVSLDRTVRVWDARTGQQLRVLTFSDIQGSPAFSPNGQEMAIPENNPTSGVSDAVRVFGTCPACQNPKALLALAAPRAAPASRLTALERTVINGS
jgi:WD40 repeat protein